LDSVGPNSPTLRTRTVRYTRTSVCVRQHTQDVRGRPSAHTGRPWPSVSTHRTSGCPSVHISARSVDCSGDFGPRGLSVQYTQDVRQHTQDVCGRPCVSVCPSAHTGRPSAHAGRPSAHAGRPWLSVCVRVSVSAHRTSVSTHRTSVSIRRTSVSTRRTSVAVRVSVSTRRTSVSTHRTSVSTQRTSGSTRRTSLSTRRRPWLSVCVRVSDQHIRTSVSTTVRPQAPKEQTWPAVSTPEDVRKEPSVKKQSTTQGTDSIKQKTKKTKKENSPGRDRHTPTGRRSAMQGLPCVSVCPVQ
ncbi:hypothetical protein IGI04_043074, partial [Brassica rapa subsp. trilocularis]